MSVRLIVGKVDGTSDGAAMYESVSGWTIGPVWEAEDAPNQIEAFLEWLREERWITVGAEVFGEEWRHDTTLLWTGSGTEITDWTPKGQANLIAYWRREFVGDDGWMLDPKECACGHHHILHDDDESDAGCVSCNCTTWRPGNKLAAQYQSEGKPVLVE